MYRDEVIKGSKIKGVLTLGEINNVKKDKGTDYISTLIKQRDDLVEEIKTLEKTKNELIESTNTQVNDILEKTKENIVTIERKAYMEGHAQGLSNGYDDGYKEAYEDTIEKAKSDADTIIKNANNTLKDINKIVYDYLNSSREDIKALCTNTVAKVLKEELQNPYTLNRLIEKTLQDYKYKSNCTIRVNRSVKSVTEEKAIQWKRQMNIQEDIFVIEDNNVDEGNAIIESDKGKVYIGLDTALEKLKNELL